MSTSSSSSAGATIAPGRHYSRYSKKRKGLFYYAYVDYLVRRLAAEARSIIDVGSHDVSLLEQFDWIERRTSLDLQRPYSSPRVEGVQADFFSYEPARRFDFAICLQVLEHVPDAQAFARKLLKTARNVLVSVPYRWPANSNPHHCHDPVDETKLALWFGRMASYELIVEEPLRDRGKARRLISYYQDEADPFDIRRFRTPKPQRPGAPSFASVREGDAQ